MTTDNKKRPDRRVIKTKKAIYNAFAKLLTEKDIENITVKDIADTAEINRKTFYNYYSSFAELVDEIENEIVNDFEKEMLLVDYNEAMINPGIFFNPLTRIISKDFDFYAHLMVTKRNSSLINKIVGSLMKSVKKSVASKADIDNLTLDIIIEYVVTGMLGVYQQWFFSNRSHSLDEISETVSKICFDGVNAFIKKANCGLKRAECSD